MQRDAPTDPSDRRHVERDEQLLRSVHLHRTERRGNDPRGSRCISVTDANPAATTAAGTTVSSHARLRDKATASKIQTVGDKDARLLTSSKRRTRLRWHAPRCIRRSRRTERRALRPATRCGRRPGASPAMGNFTPVAVADPAQQIDRRRVSLRRPLEDDARHGGHGQRRLQRERGRGHGQVRQSTDGRANVMTIFWRRTREPPDRRPVPAGNDDLRRRRRAGEADDRRHQDGGVRGSIALAGDPACAATRSSSWSLGGGEGTTAAWTTPTLDAAAAQSSSNVGRPPRADLRHRHRAAGGPTSHG